ncbi:MAG: response regulator transcription factor [Magnetococcales bacterium]|nr:response regulator transcription factor [Magnetococcales bacterium]
MTIKIFIADDHFTVREGLKTYLHTQGDFVVAGEAADGKQAQKLILSGEWDLVLLDITLPGRDGLEVLKRIRQSKPKLPVIIFTMHDEEAMALRCLKSGADGFVSKDSDPEELVAAIRTVLSGKKHITPNLANQLLLEWGRDPDTPLHEQLSEREFTVMRMMASGETVSGVAEKLALSIRTVSTHKSKVLQKLNLRNNSEMIAYAIKHKLVT